MNKGKISVIIPVFNAELYVEQTIKSVLGQTYDNFEIILIDDGSSDRSLSIIRKFEDDHRVKIISGSNKGAPHARNKGLTLADGEYIYFFDADDIMKSDALKHMIDLYSNKSVDLVVCGYEILDEKENRLYIKKKYKDGTYNLDTIKDAEEVVSIDPFPDTKLYKADIIKKYGIVFDNVRIAQDLNFYIKYLSKCKKVYLDKHIVATYRRVSGSISHSYDERIYDVVKCIDNIEKFIINTRSSCIIKDQLWNVRVIHYNVQGCKSKHMSSYNNAVKVLDYFKKKEIEIWKAHKQLLSQASKKIIIKYRLKWFLRYYYLKNCRKQKH